RRAEAQGGFELTLVRSDEQRDADAGVTQAADDGLEVVVLAGGVEAAFGGALLTLFRDDAGGVRTMAQRDLDHFLGRGHFQVEREVGRLLDALQVFVADVAAVFAQGRGGAVAADGGDGPGGASRGGGGRAAAEAARR